MNYKRTINISRKGLHDITKQIAEVVSEAGVSDGLATVFIQHTSASLIIQENADPAVLSDLEDWMEKAVPESETYAHQEEGPDDMPAHIKGAITASHVAVPIMGGKLALGIWQGIFLWEHRYERRQRTVVVNVT